jgi:nucleotide-binding universal stress UspA family protein
MRDGSEVIKKILVCLDGSKLAEQVLPYATEEALGCGSKMVLIQVIVVQAPPVVTAGASTSAIKAAEQQIERGETEAKAYLEDLAQPLREMGLHVECVTLRGSQVGGVIVDYADGHEIDLIAIATHGRSGLGRLVFGNVADFVLKKSGLPILLIKPK